MNDASYITTPIYYVNDAPHHGHAYTTIIADVMARYARLQGGRPFFLVGTDEHGQKVPDAAQRNGLDPQTHADRIVVRFRDAWERLHVEYDDFIRTTEARHTRVVTRVLQDLRDEGEIYLGDYSGWYCVPDERFWTDKDLVDGDCPDCGRSVEWIAEQNYFFRMSNYQEWLVEYIETHPFGPESGDAALSWSPDGSKILFSTLEEWHLTAHWKPGGETYVVNADGTLVLRDTRKGPYASWSPDGSRIASLGPHGEYEFEERHSYVFLSTMASDGSDVRLLLRINEDGRLIPENGKGR